MVISARGALIAGLALLFLLLGGVTAWIRRPIVTVRSSPEQVASTPAPRTAADAPRPSVPAVAVPRSAHGQVASNPAAATPVAPPAPPAETPRFDIVRVEPSGNTVVAGKGEPNAKVALVARGAVVAETMSDASGHFVMLPPSLTPGDHALSLRQMPSSGSASVSAQSVVVSVPERGKGSVVVALAEPGQATKVISAAETPAPLPAVASPPVASPVIQAPPLATAPAALSRKGLVAGAETKVAMRAVDLENGDGFHASGVAKPGTPLRLYLNNTRIADVVADPDGKWTVTIKKGLASGHYVVRADAQTVARNPAEASHKADTVVARAEVPFDVPPIAGARSPIAEKFPTVAKSQPVPTASGAAPPPTAADKPNTEPSSSETPTAALSLTPPDARRHDVAGPVASADAGNAIIDEIQTARVVNGDSLWAISLSRLGQAERYTQIYTVNEKQIRDPNLIYPGQVFVLPR